MSGTDDFADRHAPGAGTVSPVKRGRIESVDVARAVALIAMAIYHLTWDLEFFGYLPRGLVESGGWVVFARSIASSFLFLVGSSLVLAHDRGVRWRPFLVRLAQVAAGAAAITAVTAFVTPDSYVFFGILHHIALASVLGLVFLRLPFALTLALGLAVIALPRFVSTPALDPVWLAWIGLHETAPNSNDFVPLFPFFGVVLTGIAMGRMAVDHDLLRHLRGLDAAFGRLTRLGVLGRHALAFYLLHQPVLFGTIWLASQIVPPDPNLAFARDCRQACLASEHEAFCETYCACAKDELVASDLFGPLMDGNADSEQMSRIREITRLCSITAMP